MLDVLKRKLITLLQLLLVIVFIVFEEVIWEGISKPIYEFVHSLKILKRVEILLQRVNAYVILVLFVLMLGSVELLGVYAGLLFVSGKVWHGLLLYVMKIPIAAFTFWVFRVTEEKLMRFGWFKWIYGKIMAFIDWLKSLAIYQSAMQRLKAVKEQLKVWIRAVKIRYFSGESAFLIRLKRLYRHIKHLFRK